MLGDDKLSPWPACLGQNCSAALKKASILFLRSIWSFYLLAFNLALSNLAENNRSRNEMAFYFFSGVASCCTFLGTPIFKI